MRAPETARLPSPRTRVLFGSITKGIGTPSLPNARVRLRLSFHSQLREALFQCKARTLLAADSASFWCPS
jgi:hypothetical protein